jgi:predicted alpha/beta superfamily hydrolase
MAEWQEYTSPDGSQQSAVGNIKILRGLESPELGNSRDILVYLPPTYDGSERRYPVIYMHDGQNLFDAATSFAGEWAVDQTLESASEQGLEAIVVGIPNAGADRTNEYSPFKDEKHGGGRGDLYVDFLVKTVKPLIDESFRTLPESRYTGIAGSSMGGIISIYAFFREPTVFGFAGVMSPAFWFAGGQIFDYIKSAPFAPGRLYLDVGTKEGQQTLLDVQRMRDLLLGKGYRLGWDLLCVIDEGASHNEAAWRRRLRRELVFLIGTRHEPAMR